MLGEDSPGEPEDANEPKGAVLGEEPPGEPEEDPGAPLGFEELPATEEFPGATSLSDTLMLGKPFSVTSSMETIFEMRSIRS